MSTATQAGSKYLRAVSGVGTVVLSALNGQRTIANDGSNLFSYIDSDFRRWNANATGDATPETPVAVLEMTEDATFAEMFGSLSDNVESLALTQDQILSFIENHSDKLRTGGYATFFLFKSEGKLFVAYVHRRDDGSLRVYVYEFSRGFRWYGEHRHRVVVPQAS
jgi:hypothetical protein